MNWGKGIIGGMALFMLFILAMCFYMFRSPADEYDHQYYEKGLHFDRDYERQKRVKDDHAQPSIEQKGKVLWVEFAGRTTGSLKFIRPSSQALDKTFPINSGPDNCVMIPLNQIKPGRWVLVIEWQNNGKDYLYQQEINIK